MSELHEAVRRGDIKGLQDLLARRADRESRDEDGCTPIFSSLASTSSLECLHVLIDAGVDINATDSYGYTMLHSLAIGSWDEEDEKRMRVLLDAGADTEVCLHGDAQSCEWTPLMLAVYEGSAGAAKCLLEYGADIEATDEYGRTALMLAAGQPAQTEEKIRLLLQMGAVLTKRSREGKTAFDYAKSCVQLLIEGRGDPKIQQSIWEFTEEQMCSFSEFGVSPSDIPISEIDAHIRKTIANWPHVLHLLELPQRGEEKGSGVFSDLP